RTTVPTGQEGDLLKPRFYGDPKKTREILFTRHLEGGNTLGLLQLPSEGPPLLRYFESPTDHMAETTLSQNSSTTPTPQYQVSQAKRSYRLKNLALAGAFDGSQFRYFVSTFAEDLLSERLVFANSIFISDELVASFGIGNLSTGYTVTGNVSDLEESRTYSLAVNRRFALDEFREFDLFGEFEVQ